MFSIIDNGVPEEYMALARVWSIFSSSSGVPCVLMKPLRVLCMRWLHLCWFRGADGHLSVVALTFRGRELGCVRNARKRVGFLLSVGSFSRILRMSE